MDYGAAGGRGCYNCEYQIQFDLSSPEMSWSLASLLTSDHLPLVYITHHDNDEGINRLFISMDLLYCFVLAILLANSHVHKVVLDGDSS